MFLKLIFILIIEHIFVFSGAKLLEKKGYVKEGFFNSISNSNYLPFTISTFNSTNKKENHLTKH